MRQLLLFIILYIISDKNIRNYSELCYVILSLQFLQIQLNSLRVNWREITRLGIPAEIKDFLTRGQCLFLNNCSPHCR